MALSQAAQDYDKVYELEEDCLAYVWDLWWAAPRNGLYGDFQSFHNALSAYLADFPPLFRRLRALQNHPLNKRSCLKEKLKKLDRNLSRLGEWIETRQGAVEFIPGVCGESGWWYCQRTVDKESTDFLKQIRVMAAAYSAKYGPQFEGDDRPDLRGLVRAHLPYL